MKPNAPLFPNKAAAVAAGYGDDPDAPIRVTARYGYLLIADTEDICAPGKTLSLRARAVAMLAHGLGHAPTPEEIAEMTGDPLRVIAAAIRELEGTGYLDWEG
jgi:hypothetical protein